MHPGALVQGLHHGQDREDRSPTGAPGAAVAEPELAESESQLEPPPLGHIVRKSNPTEALCGVRISTRRRDTRGLDRCVPCIEAAKRQGYDPSGPRLEVLR